MHNIYKELNLVVVLTEDNDAPFLAVKRTKKLTSYYPQTNWANNNLSKAHLYIVSEEAIEAGDTYLNSEDIAFQCGTTNLPSMVNDIKACRKVIASTDPKIFLPSIPTEFLEVMSYSTTKVLVQYGVTGGREFLRSGTKKVITIKECKLTFTREEVKSLMVRSVLLGFEHSEEGFNGEYGGEDFDVEYQDINNLLNN
jgi:hypothetical protein